MYKAHDLLVDYWDVLYPHEEYRNQNLRLVAEVMDRFRSEEQIRILDLCCGTGRALSLFSEEERVKLFGIDENSKMIEMARQNYPNAEFVNSSITDLEDKIFSQTKFHCVTMVGGSTHLFNHNERQIIFRKAHQVLRDNGIFVVDVFHSEERDRSKDPVVWIKKAFTNDKRDVIILYQRVFGNDLSKQLVYLIESEVGSDPKMKCGESIIFDLSSQDVKNELIGFSDINYVRTNYQTTEFIFATK